LEMPPVCNNPLAYRFTKPQERATQLEQRGNFSRRRRSIWQGIQG
jgi:hypothetical protein